MMMGIDARTTHSNPTPPQQVKAAEVCPSKAYSINYTLRFPRITRHRLNDKVLLTAPCHVHAMAPPHPLINPPSTTN